jgi:3-deoxy-D-manno-octulosonic-acid transferase
MHCASLGEFEQGRALIEAIRKQYPQHKILLSFFSPSGYEIRKNYALADHVCYLPLDTPANARDFLAIARPKMAFFVKYDLWLNLIAACAQTKIPLVLVSALVRPDSKFLTSTLAPAYRQAFASMHWIFTQDQKSLELLQGFVVKGHISVAGDTRFDRAIELLKKYEPVPGIADFVGAGPCVVAGSPWPKDEAIILPVIERMRHLGLKWIIAPHEIHPERIAKHTGNSHGRMIAYSNLHHATPACDVVWIDNIGMLSRLYHDATIAYIGGGFGAGIHNTQEAAVYGCPVVFGPRYEKFQEAIDMIRTKGAVAVHDADTLEAALLHWLQDEALLKRTRTENQAYMASQAGATDRIMTALAGLLYQL